MKLVIAGTGGVGGFFGSKLALSGEEVWFLARGPHLTAMLQTGLRVHSTEGSWVIPPGRMTDNPANVGVADVVLFCVKSYHTRAAAQQLTPLLSDTTIVISLQNGIDNEEIIKGIIPRGTVFGGVANIYSTITQPGEITETGGPRKLVFGALQREPASVIQKGEDLLHTMIRAKINAEVSEDILKDLWKKFIFITAVGGLTALTRLSLGEILEVQETRSLLITAMRETESVARERGIRIEPDFVSSVLELLKRFNTNTRSSLYFDLSQGKPMEVEALSGSVVKLGRELGIPTPVHNTIFSSLLPYHLRHSGLLRHNTDKDHS